MSLNHNTNFNHTTSARTTKQDILHSIFHENKKSNQFYVTSHLMCDGTDPVVVIFMYHLPTNSVIQKAYFNADGTAWTGNPSTDLTNC